jgi:C1A family cysteine protease
MRPEKLPYVPTINFVAVIKLIRKLFGHKSIPIRNFGLKKDKFDLRDKVFSPRYKVRILLPESTERRNFINFPFRWDQGDKGSCTGHGGAAGFIQALLRNGQQIFEPSRIFPYYNARDAENKQEDSGASIRDVIKGLNKYGVCREETWPSIPSKFAETPSEEAYREAADHQTLEYYRIYPVTKEAIISAIYEGYAVVYGQILYESFMSEEVRKTGIVPYPKCWEDQVGGHCKCITDYEKEGVFELNSWGRSWGSDGGCLIPWKYVLDKNKSFDFWVIKLTE